MLIDEKIKEFNTNKPNKKTYTVDEATRMLGCTRQSIYKLIKKGCFEAIKIDNNVFRIKKESFDRWLDNE